MSLSVYYLPIYLSVYVRPGVPEGRRAFVCEGVP